MTKTYLRDLRADAVSLLKERGQWVIAGVETSVAWPKEAQVVPFGGHDFILRPLTDTDSATVCLNAEKSGVTTKDARDVILRFGSALAWSEGHSFEVKTWLGSSHAIRIGRGKGSIVQEFLDPETLPDAPDDDGATALAFFREGLSSTSNFYAFLSLYKVISFIHRDGKQRGEWVGRILPTLSQPDVRSRINEIQADGTDASEYLRDSGRHAIAHAERDVFVNPDKLVDHERIYKDLPVVRALAQKAIEERFRIFPRASRDVPEKTPLPGFQRTLTAENVAKLLRGEDIDWTTLRFPASITALVRRGNQIVAFESLRVDEIARRMNGFALKLANPEGTLFLSVAIDFRNRKLLYEPQGNCGATLDTDSRSSVGLFRNLHEFNWLYYGNGRLELWGTDTDELLGMTDTYIPLNMFLDHKAMDQTRMQLQQMLDSATKD